MCILAVQLKHPVLEPRQSRNAMTQLVRLNWSSPTQQISVSLGQPRGLTRRLQPTSAESAL
ncbi:MAG: hypothetical protein ABSH28_04985, partial [Acidobacteriota bacterium]